MRTRSAYSTRRSPSTRCRSSCPGTAATTSIRRNAGSGTASRPCRPASGQFQRRFRREDRGRRSCIVQDRGERSSQASRDVEGAACVRERHLARRRDATVRGLEWCCQRGLNSRPLHYQWSALPLSYGSEGVERRYASPGNADTAPPVARRDVPQRVPRRKPGLHWTDRRSRANRHASLKRCRDGPRRGRSRFDSRSRRIRATRTFQEQSSCRWRA